VPTKNCVICGNAFHARLNVIKTCGPQCRAYLIGAAKKYKNTRSKSCIVCGAQFTLVGTKVHDRMTCSLSCSYKLRGDSQKNRVNKLCQTCGIDFEVPVHAAETARYCSRRCLYRRNFARTSRNCFVCGTEFTSPPSQLHVQTCSPSCGYEIRDNHDRRIECQCDNCGKVFLESPSIHAGRIFCSRLCMYTSVRRNKKLSDRMKEGNNPQWKGGLGIHCVSATGKAYTRLLPEIENEKNVRRKRVRVGATPAWANLEMMRLIYKMARELSEKLGVSYHVDHIVPLQSDLVCGLHCEANLQILTALENLKKHNRTWPDMP
jgi:hypothetical protein